MPRGPRWTHDENEFLMGVLQNHGYNTQKWPAEVREMVRTRLEKRTESGIYQQALKLLRARKTLNENVTDEYNITFGA